MTPYKSILSQLMVFCLCLSRGDAACKTDEVEEYQCFSENGSTIKFMANCPSGEIIVVESVYYAISEDDECPVFDPNPYAFDSAPRCVIEELTSLFQRRCDGKDTCQISMFKTADSTTCPQFAGRHYLEVKYKCDPGSQTNADEPVLKIIEMCENIDWTGRYAEIVSDKDDLLTGSIPCKCEIHKSNDSMLTLKSTLFETVPPVIQPLCTYYRTLIQTDSHAVSYLCESDGLDWNLGCEDTKKITLAYETRTVKVEARFRLTAKVPKSSTMRIKCGIPDPDALTYPPTPPPTQGPITLYPPGSGSSPSEAGSPDPSPVDPGQPSQSSGGTETGVTEPGQNGPVVGAAPLGLDTGATIGIAVGVIVIFFIIAVVVAIILLSKRRKSAARKKLVSNYTDSSGSSRTGTDSSTDSHIASVRKFDNKGFIEALGEFASVPDTMTGSLAADQASDQASLYATWRSNGSISGTMDSTVRGKAGYYKSTGSIGSLRSNKSATAGSRVSTSRVSLHSVVLEEDALLVLERKNNQLFQRFEDSNC